jgi:23S rRNA pseudouridine955/2504/2580 synthase
MEHSPREGASRTGVSYLEATSGDEGQRIDNYLVRQIKGVPRSLIYRILRTGEVRVNGRRAKPEYRLAPGDRIRLPPMQRDEKPEAKLPSKSLRDFIASAVIFEDKDLHELEKSTRLSFSPRAGTRARASSCTYWPTPVRAVSAGR